MHVLQELNLHAAYNVITKCVYSDEGWFFFICEGKQFLRFFFVSSQQIEHNLSC